MRPSVQDSKRWFVVGLITSADQFVPVQPIIETEFETVVSEQYYLPTHNVYLKNIRNTEKTIGLASEPDIKRQTTINNIRLVHIIIMYFVRLLRN